jgi:acyl carrier protein
METHVRDQVARVVRIDPNLLDVEAPLGSLGFDSLLALELRNRLESTLGLELPATLVWSHRDICALATYLAEQLAPPSGGTPNGKAAPESSAAPLADLGLLSRAEAERLLAEELSRLPADLLAEE